MKSRGKDGVFSESAGKGNGVIIGRTATTMFTQLILTVLRRYLARFVSRASAQGD